MTHSCSYHFLPSSVNYLPVREKIIRILQSSTKSSTHTHTHTHTHTPPRDKNGQSLKNYITMAESRVWLSGLNNKLHLSYQQFAPSIHSTTLEWGETIQRLYQCSRYRIHLLSECNSTKETDNTTTLENHKF